MILKGILLLSILVSRIPTCDSTTLRVPAGLFGKKQPAAYEQGIVDVYKRALSCVAALEVLILVKPKRGHWLARLFRKRKKEHGVCKDVTR